MEIDEIDNWANNVISFWKTKDIELGAGASLVEIEKTEKIVGLNFPEAFKILYQKRNGFTNWGWTENMFSIWTLEKIVEEYNYGRNNNFVAFSDFLINSHWIGFAKDKSGVFKWYDLQEYPIMEKIADKFEDAIQMINSNSDNIY